MRNILILMLAMMLSACGGSTTRPDPIGQNNAGVNEKSVKESNASESTVQVASDKQADQPFTVKQTAAGAEAVTGDFARSRLIAADFATTLSQIPETNPAVTILHTETPSSRFGELLLSALQGAGFDLRLGDNSSNSWLSYSAEQDAQPTLDNNPVYTFIVAAGDVKLKRSYEVDEYGVKPRSNMFVRGASAANLTVDDSIFNNARPATVVAKNEVIDNNDDSFFEQIAATTQPELSAVPAQKPIEVTEAVVPELSIEQAGKEIHNLYETRQSKYQDVFKNYEVIDSNVLVFANDSLVLGQANKDSIATIAAQFDPQTDVMSVIGCSHGASKIENGNAYLANNRAIRVKNEFVTVGLNHTKVYEEGCWDKNHFSKMPARGVLVQHRRLRG